MRLRDLSFRYKIPLRATLLVLVTVFMITAGILARDYDQLRQDLFGNADSMGRVLAHNLITPMLHDDVWRAYEIINTPFQADERTSLGAQLILLVDTAGRVYASTRPFHFPMQAQIVDLGPEYAALARHIVDADLSDVDVIELQGFAHFHVVTPIVFDGVPMGHLVMEYPRSIFARRFRDIVERAGVVTLLVLALLLPISWYWGRRMAQPLVQLAGCMGMVRDHIPSEQECHLYESRDEIGQAGTQFRRMLAELREKELLEQSMLASERLAVVGRITAGIAHEINNPLGGMLNAISTQRKHGVGDPLTERTLSLLDRGLKQIRDTVGALLVEARLTSHALGPEDVEDIRTLVGPEAQKRSVVIDWRNDVHDRVELPSSQVRQILLNLLLNAVQASDPGASVQCRLEHVDSMLHIRVANAGTPIGQEQMQHLFEPFVGGSGNGSGLGLWVTYQLVSQMEGRIEVESGDGRETRFDVYLPLCLEMTA